MKLELMVNLTRTYPLIPKRDSESEYIEYCDYNKHPGVIVPGRSKICKGQLYEHYKLFRRYLEDEQ